MIELENDELVRKIIELKKSCPKDNLQPFLDGLKKLTNRKVIMNLTDGGFSIDIEPLPEEKDACPADDQNGETNG